MEVEAPYGALPTQENPTALENYGIACRRCFRDAGSPALRPVSGTCGARHRDGPVALRPTLTSGLPFSALNDCL